MSTPSRAGVTGLLSRHFQERFGDTAGVTFALAPGRVNLLGDHTDYNDGFVLPMTVDRAVYWALRRRDDATVRLYSVNFDGAVDYPLARHPKMLAGEWSSYAGGVIEELRRRGLVDGGFEGVVYGDVPLGGGLSSSAALEVATAVALQRLFGFPLEPVEAARLCQHVEHVYAGVQCGIMDQFASRLGRRDHALRLDCRTLDYEHIPLALEEIRVVIVNSGVKRALTGSKYNERRAECRHGVEHFRQYDPAVTALRDVSPELLERHAHELPEAVGRRCRHVVAENQRVAEAAALLRDGHFDAFGQLMNDSHASLRDLYEVSCPELDALVEIAQGSEGVLGARMTGAGFGGCTVHLVRRDAVAALEERLRREYPRRCGLEPAVFVLRHNLEAGQVVETGD